MDELAAFVDRATAAGAPRAARIRLESADRNVLLGLTVPGTRLSVTWAYHKPNPHTPADESPTTHAGPNVAHSGPGAHPGPYDETELVIERGDLRYRQEGIRNRQEARNRQELDQVREFVDPNVLALVNEREGEQLDVRTHADPPTPDEAVDLGIAEPWPFKPGDVVTDAEDAIAEQLDAAPEGTVVVDAAGVEWTNGWNRPADEAPAWVLESSRTSPELPDRVLSADLADLGPLTVVKVREAQSPPAEPWPFKPGDVIEGTDDAATVKLDDAPVGTVVADAAADEWKHEGLSSWVGTYRTNSAGLAARGSLTVVRVGDR
jgi:hypothetical protein